MNVFEYAARCEQGWEKGLKEMGNYKRKTTFYADLSMAECYGKDEVKDTYRRVMKSWIDDVEYITEFILCLNHKAWEWYGRKNREMSELYSTLYEEGRDKFYEKYEGDEKACDYFFKVMD